MFLFLPLQHPKANPSDLAQMLMDKRKVRKNLHLQDNTAAFREEHLLELQEEKKRLSADQLAGEDA